MKYFVWAGIAFIVDFWLLYIFTDIVGIYYIFSNIISYTSWTLVNFWLNKKYTFENKYKNKIKQFTLFLVVSLFNLLIATFLLYVFVNYWNIHYLYAKIISTWIWFIINFLWHKYITFNYLK